MKILVVEDDATIRDNLARTLRLEGYEPLAAGNGRQALALLQEHTPALILSDVMMPELDGHGLLAQVRANPNWSSIPFVFITAKASRGDVREGMTQGADDYLTKPFQRDELLALLTTQLARATQRNEVTSRLQRETERLRSFDSLTDLPNRSSLLAHTERCLLDAAKSGDRAVIASIGFSGLSEYRTARGSVAANQAVRALAENLECLMRGFSIKNTVLARSAEERFGLLISGAGADHSLEGELRSLASLASRICLDGETELLFPSFIGVGRYPANAQTAEHLLHCAESAEPLPAANATLAFYSAEATARIGRRVQLQQALHHALDRDELFLVYQPQTAALSGRLVGLEALLRWQHPELGSVSPAEFIPIAEDSGLIVPIGSWVMQEAAGQAKRWLTAGLGPLRVAVNLSSKQFVEDDLAKLVTQVLRTADLPSSALELEITESIAMLSAQRTQSTLRALKALGLHLAMDDFGTGYSSLAYLRQYSLDSLKIDQSFVRGLTDDACDAAIPQAIIALARSLDMQTVAEGVENKTQLDVLRELGCDVCQGYLISRPMDASAATHCLMDHASAQRGPDSSSQG